MQLDVHLLPALTNVDELAEHTVVVIDVLRATTTITQALASGAKEVIPCLEIDEARQLAAEMTDTVVLGGERGGQRIPGFDLGNSPREYTPESLSGKTLVFTTTNGTRAMQLARKARKILLGSFRNLSAVVTELQRESQIALLCAGTEGHVTGEDVLFAGAVISHLRRFATAPPSQNDEAILAFAAWQEIVRGGTGALVEGLRHSRGGRNLIGLDMSDDIDFAAEIDRTGMVGELRRDRWHIRGLDRNSGITQASEHEPDAPAREFTASPSLARRAREQ